MIYTQTALIINICMCVCMRTSVERNVKSGIVLLLLFLLTREFALFCLYILHPSLSLCLSLSLSLSRSIPLFFFLCLSFFFFFFNESFFFAHFLCAQKMINEKNKKKKKKKHRHTSIQISAQYGLSQNEGRKR